MAINLKMKEYYKSPLTMYVVWHPAFKLGIRYAEALYNTFCRDVNSPLSRALGIPILFRFQREDGGSVPLDIDTTLSDRNAIILLIDDEMFSDGNWYSYIQKLLDKENLKSTRLFPVALSKYAFSLDENRLTTKQFINLTSFNESSECLGSPNGFQELKSRLLHDLSRLFFKLEKVSDSEKQISPPPIKLFISHAKIDGELLAIQFRDFINSNTKLKTFFDANDIADAEEFEFSIKQNLSNSAIVVFLSDQYSNREWCRIEVIVAKRNKSPLVVVNNIQKGERRSFPYLGNVPTLRYEKDGFKDIIDLALFQVLNNLYVEEKLRKEIELYELNSNFHVIPLENVPELFNYIDLKRLQKEHSDKTILVIYPDPPLGIEEMNVLNDFDENVKFITPTSIHQISML
jgi:hypothetical protein